MRHTLPRLKRNVLLVALLAMLSQQLVSAPLVAADGSQLIAQAAEQMGTYDALQCRIRQRVRLFDQELNGNGSYQQARIGDQLRLRLELKLPVGDQTTHLQQINDGERLWIRRVGYGEQRLAVVDVRKVRETWSKTSARADRALAIGGISQLLTGLEQQFDFVSSRPGKLGKEPVWIVEGTWKTDDKGTEQGGELGRLPQVPTAVLVVLSRDELLPLFPFRIEYYRDVRTEEGTSQRETMMTIEFFEVGMLHKIDQRNFTYSVGEQDIVDETDLFLEQH